jgi:hypothetical protein
VRQGAGAERAAEHDRARCLFALASVVGEAGLHGGIENRFQFCVKLSSAKNTCECALNDED